VEKFLKNCQRCIDLLCNQEIAGILGLIFFVVLGYILLIMELYCTSTINQHRYLALRDERGVIVYTSLLSTLLFIGTCSYTV